MKKILIAGGGTAGHAWPLLLVGENLLKNSQCRLLYVGSRQGIERKLIKNFPGIRFRPIIVGKWRAYFSFWNFYDAIKIFIGLIQAFFMIIFFKPKVIFAKGGYVALPIIFWAKFLKIALVIHESDAVLGRANLWTAKFASKICLGFPLESYQENLPGEKLVYTGTPVRADFSNYTDKKDHHYPKILVTGGSQGSSKINQTLWEILPRLCQKYEIFHLAGKIDFLKFSNFKNDRYHLFNFSNQMPRLMREAEIVVSRGGANTLMEIAAAARSSIIIPLPSAAQNHQLANARVFEKNQAAIILLEKNLTSDLLFKEIENLVQNQQLRQKLGLSAQKFFQKNAVQAIINIIFQQGKDDQEN